MGSHRQIICALDTSDLDEAIKVVHRLGPHIGGFKVGHSLTLPYGLAVVDRLREHGADRIFLDLKFHDIPNTVGLAVREAAKRGVWMMTLHTSGGPAMITAAVVEANCYPETERPILVGVNVLTSIDEHMLKDHLGVARSLDDHMIYLSKLGVDCGLDGVVCSPEEVARVRSEIDHTGLIITPGIRHADHPGDDQVRVGEAKKALQDGANYLVIGRGLMKAEDPVEALFRYGLAEETGLSP